MAKFKHYILTKYNIGLYDRDLDPDDWMQEREYLFENYALRSLCNQRCKDYTWVIGFDDRTPDKYLIKYDYIDNIQVVIGQPHEWLREQPMEADWIITSRFDNDDFYSRDFVTEVQWQFRGVNEVIDVDYLQHVRGRKVERYDPLRPRPNSPFLSVVEEWGDGLLTAFGRPHTYMPDELPARKIERVLAWQIIHGSNMGNQYSIHKEARLR